MKIDINLKECSREFIEELARNTTSPKVLDEIVDFAINEEHYTNYQKTPDGKCCHYMDEVIKNEHLSKESIMKIINYEKSSELHFMLIDNERLFDEELIKLYVEKVKDLSILESIYSYYTLDTVLSDQIAHRIVSGDVIVENCMDYFGFMNLSRIRDGIDIIASHCSNSMKSMLVDWVNTLMLNEQYVKETAPCSDVIARCIMGGDLKNVSIPKNSVDLDNIIINLADCCSNTTGTKLINWWNRQKNKSSLTEYPEMGYSFFLH